MSRIKSIAYSFGMSVTEFATFTGYSKQGLYQMLDGTNGTCTPRLRATINHLKFASDSMHDQDIAEARIQKNNRDKAIKELEHFLGVPDLKESEYRKAKYVKWHNNYHEVLTIGCVYDIHGVKDEWLYIQDDRGSYQYYRKDCFEILD